MNLMRESIFNEWRSELFECTPRIYPVTGQTGGVHINSGFFPQQLLKMETVHFVKVNFRRKSRKVRFATTEHRFAKVQSWSAFW